MAVGIFAFPSNWKVLWPPEIARRRSSHTHVGDFATKKRVVTSWVVTSTGPSPRSGGGALGTRASCSNGEEEAAVIVGALVGVGEHGVGSMDTDEVLGGGGVRGGVRVDGEGQAAVRGLDLPRAGYRAESEDVVEGVGRVVGRRGGDGG